MQKDDVTKYHKEYEAWEKEYSPMEFLEYDGEGGENYLKAQNTPNEFVWTDHGTCEDNMVSAGFHFFGDPVRCCWDTHGWYISKVSSGNTSIDHYESYRSNYYAECECYKEETDSGDENCEDCWSSGWRTYWFD
jgi:hypothetical protein